MQPGCVGFAHSKKEVIAVGLGVLTSSLQNSVAFQRKRRGDRAEMDEDPTSSGLFQVRVEGQTFPEVGRAGNGLMTVP